MLCLSLLSSLTFTRPSMPTVIVLFFANGLDVEIRGKLIKDFGFRELKSGLLHFEFAFVDGL